MGRRATSAVADTLPTVTVGSASVVEGDAGTAVVKVPIDLSAPSAAKVTVSYEVKGGTATAGSDFVAHKAKMSFVPGGPVSKVISVTVRGDSSPEPDESVLVDLSSPVNATLGNTEGVVTILDDDSDGNMGLQVSAGNITVEEANAGPHFAYLPITLSQPAPSTVKVYYSITCSDAIAGVDYQAKHNGTLTFLHGQQTKQLKFTIDADMTVENAVSILETIKVTSGPAAVYDTQGDTTIIDNDGGGSDGLPSLPFGGVERESVNSDGIGGQSPNPSVCSTAAFGSFDPSISADGRYVAFISDNVNLVPDDNNGEWDAFVRDRVTGAVERVSVATDGSETAPNGIDGAPYPGADLASISPDGRYVTFWESRELGGYPGHEYFIHDRQTGTTVPLLQDMSGHPVDAGSFPAVLSSDDRYVAYESCGDSSGVLVPTDLDPPHPPQDGAACDVFRYDRATNTSVLVSQPADNSPSDGYDPSMSANGRYVAFWSTNADYVAGDTNGCGDAFVRDMVTGTFDRINVTTAGDQDMADSTGECESWQRVMSLSDDGRYVAFGSSGWVLAGLTSPTDWTAVGVHTYVRDRVAGTTTMVDSGGRNITFDPSISGDGAYVGYWCNSGVACDDESQYLVTDLATGDTVRASELADGMDGDAGDVPYQGGTALSTDGSYAVFATSAANLDPTDDNDTVDVFLKRVH